MITNQRDYEKALAKIQEEHHFPIVASFIDKIDGFKDGEKDPLSVYSINLNTREIDAPEYLSVEKDHQAETIYFKIDRYFGHIDLSNMIFLIQYKNARLECYNYLVPYLDVVHEDGYIYFPWCIESPVTRFAGKVTYSLKIFYVNPNSERLVFELNTLPATGLIKSGWGSQSAGELDYSKLTINEEYVGILDAIRGVNEAIQQGNFTIKWVDVDEAVRNVPATKDELNIINTVKG